MYVGEMRKKSVLHKYLICQLSPFFDGMFNGILSEGMSQECSLPEDNIAAFEILVSRVYSRTFPTNCAEIVAAKNGKKVYDSIIRFYSLADRILLPKGMKVEAMRALVEAQKDHPTSGLWSSTVVFALRDLAEDCPMRTLVVEPASHKMLCARSSPGWQQWLLNVFQNVESKHSVELMMALQERVDFDSASFSAMTPKEHLQSLPTPDLLPRFMTGFLKPQK